MSEQGDLDRALASEANAVHHDPGTTATHPTLRKGVVTSGTSGGSISCEVDGMGATNITGNGLSSGDVVWMLVDQGRRLVTGLTRMAAGDEIVLGVGQMVPATGGASVGTFGAGATSHIPVAVLPGNGNSSVACSTLVPAGWSAFDVDVWWMQTDSGSGSVALTVRHSTTALGSRVGSGTPQSFTESVPGTIRVPERFTAFEGVNRSDGVLRIQLHRTPGDGSFSGDVGIVQVVLRRS